MKDRPSAHPKVNTLYLLLTFLIKYLVKLIDIHGFTILRSDSNRQYSSDFKIYVIKAGNTNIYTSPENYKKTK